MVSVPQVGRGILQLGRNFGSEWIAQKVERDIREELYASLLGKSMTFHNLQPVGDTMARATNDVREVNFLFSPGVNLVVGSMLFLVMPFIFTPQYSPGLLRMLEFPTFSSSFAYTQISLGVSGARRILELINRESNLDQNAAGYARPMRGEIEFKDVSFAYPMESVEKEEGRREKEDPADFSLLLSRSGETVLDKISFTVKPGQTVAIVGQTGAGKTSMLKLANRTYDVTGGQVLVDGIDVRDWNLADLRSQISMIEQDIFLFSRSIAENVAFGKPGPAFADVEAAAVAAQADDFIQSFDQGYETVIGDRGLTLSGGQAQPLPLARAVLPRPRVLILDDSTSAIDSATEDKIQRAIANAAKGRTTLIITHRLSQILWANLVILMRKGKIAAMVNSTELMKSSEAYSRLFKE